MEMKNQQPDTDTAPADSAAQMAPMLAGLAHEIRNPLSTVKVNLKLLAEDVADMAAKLDENGCFQTIDDPARRFARQLKKLQTIADETARVEETLNDFMRFAGRMELQKTRCDLHTLLDDLVDFYEPQAQAAGVQMRLSLTDEPMICQADADGLKQAFLNLLLNATQVMKNGGELMVRSRRDRDTVQVDVSDTGPGNRSGYARDDLPALCDHPTRRDGAGTADVSKNYRGARRKNRCCTVNRAREAIFA